MDNDEILRISGRLQQSGKPYSERHPCVLTRRHGLGELLARQSHRQVLHGGVRDTLVQLRERYWVVRARQLVKSIIKGCITCQRFNARPATEVTAPLPRDRVTQAQPFEVTGVDFAGPLLVKGENAVHKSYVTLFTCAVTRAVHLELVRDMSTESFLMALRRFISRRGVPRIIYSDNALSFKKANKDLQQLWSAIRDPEALGYFSNARIEWKFIVERAPWWGGFYERLVGSAKLSLKKAIGSRFLHFDELATTLTEIEAVLNSRPLTHVYDEPGEPEPLCPSFFLTGRRLTTLPSMGRRDVDGVPTDIGRAWTLRQQTTEAFWRRWTREYLAELRNVQGQRERQGKPLSEGDLVLLRDSLRPRQQWRLARIQNVFPGRDGKVRSCLLKLPGGSTLKRPIQLLYPLEIA